MFARAFSSTVRLSARRLTLRQMSRWSPPAPPTPWSRPLSTASDVVKDKYDPANPPSPTGTCFIANVPYNVAAEQLKDAFSGFGKVRTVRLLTSETGLSRGVGFVEFDSVDEAVKFVDANEEDPMFVLDRQLFVRHAHRSMKPSVKPGPEPSDTLVFSHSGDGGEDAVREMFGDYADSVLAVRFPRKQEGFTAGKAFVQFRNVDIATEAMDALRSLNKDLQVTYAKQRQSPGTSSPFLTSRLSQQG